MSVMKETGKTWCPAIEFNETEDNLILKAEIPGVEIKHLNINAEPESVSISGIHDHHQSSTEKELIPTQLHYGQLQCTVPLPEKIQINHVRAELIDGLLTITMPKVNITSSASIS
ncbi:MAG: Hsp20/alpha crystallin family protein [Cyanobacteria bacterium J06638_38]